jgi:ribosomal protein S18 acetylase RimI-like enzyme
MTVTVRVAAPEDYDSIAAVMDIWWGRQVVGILPRLFLLHFHSSSLVAHDDAGLAGFLVGFMSPDRTADAYIHAVGIRPDLRSGGLATDLYERFFAQARQAGRTIVTAVTSSTNTGSVVFHRRMGFAIMGPVANYHGPGQDRYVFERRI